MRARRLRVHRHEPVGGGVSELGVEAGGGRDVRACGGCGRAGGLMSTRPWVGARRGERVVAFSSRRSGPGCSAPSPGLPRLGLGLEQAHLLRAHCAAVGLEPGRAQEVGGGGPGSGVGLQHTVHQQAQPRLVEVLRDRGVRAVGNLVDKAHEALSFEGVLEGAQLVHDAAQGPDIGLVRVRLVGAHLWGHVVRRAHEGIGKVFSAFHNLRNSKVPKLDHPSARQENVLGFEVPMKHLLAVDVVQAHCNLDEPLYDLRLRKLLLLLARLLDLCEQVPVLTVGGDDAQRAVVEETLLVSDDVGVAQRGEQLSFAQCRLALLLFPQRDSFEGIEH
mmetsp:Transcript_18866/g.35991  ORF Transcript_18866/g.35991 Transcript_18866/m.35991 type:complete len:332 (-) Transcript_18866:15-1010(-)